LLRNRRHQRKERASKALLPNKEPSGPILLSMSSSAKKITAGVLAVFIILFSLGFRVGHAQDGLKNALGSAKSGLVVYKNKPSFTVGSKVLVKLDAPAPSPLLAFVMGNKAETVEIQAGTTVQSVKSSQVYGTLIAVIPFLGSILSVVGL
jgi:hypothetical protein